MQRALLNRMFIKTNRYAIKMHEITFMKCFNSFYFCYLHKIKMCTIKKCDMFLIAAVTEDNDLGGST